MLKVLGKGVPTPQCLRDLPQATPHGTIPLSRWITTRQSPLCAGTPMKTSTSTMRTAWTVCAVEGQAGSCVACGERHAECQHCPTHKFFSAQAPWPTQGAPWMAVLMPRCSGSPARRHRHLLQSSPHPQCSLSAATRGTHPRSPQSTQQNPPAGRPQLLLKDRSWIVCWEAVEWPVRAGVLGERPPS